MTTLILLAIFIVVASPPTTGTFINGYTSASCVSLVPPGQSNVKPQDNHHPTLSIDTKSYVPGKEYTVTLDKGDSYGIKAFMIQGRIKGKNQTVGYFSNAPAELVSLEAKLLNCSSVRDTLTNYNPNDKNYQMLALKWTAPKPSVGEICLHFSTVEMQRFWFKPTPLCLPPDLSTPPTAGPTLNSTATSATTPPPVTTVPVTTAAGTTQSVATTPAPVGQRVEVRPSKLEAVRGQTSSFKCELYGTPTPTFQEWARVHDDGRRLSAGIRNPYVITNVLFSDQGTYECEATASDGRILRGKGELVVKEKPSVTTHPAGAIFVLGKRSANVTMSCDGIGGHPLSYSWLKDGVALVGETGKSLTVPPIKDSGGAYQCQITNAYGNAVSQIASIVVYIEPYFTVQPRSYDANAGSMAFFTCEANGSPKPSIHWVKDGMTLNDQTKKMLGFANVDMSHEGEYWCRATNLVRSVDSDKANLTVITVPPTFDVIPLSATVNYGKSFNLSCATRGYPQPKIQWLKNGVVLPGKTGGSLTVKDVIDADAGTYSCNATNSIGSTVSQAATVKIYKEGPSFVKTPLGGRIFVGRTHNFTAEGYGVPLPTYSWFKEGVRIPGATRSYLLIDKATRQDGGIYFCRLTNIVTSKDSTKVYLIVTVPPTTEAPTTTVVPTTEEATTEATTVPYTETTEPTIETSMIGSGSEAATPTSSPTATSASTPETTLRTTLVSPSEEESSVNIAVIISPFFAVLAVIIIVLVTLLVIQRRRQNLGTPRRKSASLDKLVLTREIDSHDDALSTEGDRVHMTALKAEIKSDIKSSDLEQLLGRTPTYVHRISKSCAMDGLALKTLLDRARDQRDSSSDDPDEIKKQFEETPSNMITIQKTPAGTESKNRYMNVLPNPHSAVHLEVIDDDPTTSYINANYVRGYNMRPREYIATQGPIPSTRDDFWRMIWEQKVTIIVMSTGLIERGRMKCCRYWPDTNHENRMTYGNISVRVVDEKPGSEYIVTTLAARNLFSDEESTEDSEERLITHYWFTSWPDFGIPKESGPVLDFLSTIRKEITLSSGPVLVHCSAGIGRTGTFVAIDMGMQQYDEEGKVDPLMYLCLLRQDRGGSIQTADQYLFVHEALANYIDMKSK
ncbi:uncharacterized protein [Oscarella lobularis]|uniref:uncharacterized protein isoform X2 n=1 Tax=Oscarella lobularis TaxID=121494 RepID=UPI0033141AD0